MKPVPETQTVEVTATSTSIYPTVNSATTEMTSFETTFKNPCIDSDYVTISNPALINQVYELYEFDPTGFQFTHHVFEIKTKPIVHTLCGTVSYESTYDGDSLKDVVSSSSNPVMYHAANRTHDVYSEDISLIDTTNDQNMKPYTVTAYLTEYDTVKSATSSGIIEFIDPCPSPESLVAADQNNPADYYYTASDPKMEFVATGYVVEPIICAITYSCAVKSSPTLPSGTDLCDVAEDAASGVFDKITGNYDFSSLDMAKYPPGDYTFTITATVGDKTVSKDFTVTFVDPCPTTTLTLNSPFVDKTYNLRDPQIDQKWDIDTVLSKVTAVDCGAITVKIYDNDSPSTPLDSILSDIRVDANDFNFAVLYTEDVSKKATYKIGVTAYFTNYVSNS